MAKRFPKDIFIKVESDNSGNEKLEWFLADEDMAGLVSMGAKEKIAVYRLVEIREATGVVSHRKVAAR